MTATTSRRAILAGTAALPVLAAPTVANHDSDAEMRQLWREYLASVASTLDAGAAHTPFREVFDNKIFAEDVTFDEREGLLKSLSNEPDFKRTWAALEAAWDRQRAIVVAIHRLEATTLFAIGAKLAAMPAQPDGYDYKDAAISVMRDLDRLLGTEFATRHEDQYLGVLADNGPSDDEEDEV